MRRKSIAIMEKGVALQPQVEAKALSIIAAYRHDNYNEINSKLGKLGFHFKVTLGKDFNTKERLSHEFDFATRLYGYLPEMIPKPYMLGEVGGVGFYLSEKVQGEELRKYILDSPHGVQDSYKAIWVEKLTGLEKAMKAARVEHRDLHARNLLIKPNGDLVVIDPFLPGPNMKGHEDTGMIESLKYVINNGLNQTVEIVTSRVVDGLLEGLDSDTKWLLREYTVLGKVQEALRSRGLGFLANELKAFESGIERFSNLLKGEKKPEKSKLIIVGGAQGVGKTTVLDELEKRFAGMPIGIVHYSKLRSAFSKKLYDKEWTEIYSEEGRAVIDTSFEFIKNLPYRIVIVDSHHVWMNGETPVLFMPERQKEFGLHVVITSDPTTISARRKVQKRGRVSDARLAEIEQNEEIRVARDSARINNSEIFVIENEPLKIRQTAEAIEQKINEVFGILARS